MLLRNYEEVVRLNEFHQPKNECVVRLAPKSSVEFVFTSLYFYKKKKRSQVCSQTTVHILINKWSLNTITWFYRTFIMYRISLERCKCILGSEKELSHERETLLYERSIRHRPINMRKWWHITTVWNTRKSKSNGHITLNITAAMLHEVMFGKNKLW